MNRNILLIPAFLVATLLVSCESKLDPNDPSSVRQYLEDQKIAMTPAQYVAFSLKGDTASISYASVYPLGMFIRVVIAQMLIVIFA